MQNMAPMPVADTWLEMDPADEVGSLGRSSTECPRIKRFVVGTAEWPGQTLGRS